MGLSNLDAANAYTLAKKYSNDAKGKLADVVGGIIMNKGDAADYDFIAKTYNDMPPRQEKLQASADFPSFFQNSLIFIALTRVGGFDDSVFGIRHYGEV